MVKMDNTSSSFNIHGSGWGQPSQHFQRKSARNHQAVQTLNLEPGAVQQGNHTSSCWTIASDHKHNTCKNVEAGSTSANTKLSCSMAGTIEAIARGSSPNPAELSAAAAPCTSISAEGMELASSASGNARALCKAVCNPVNGMGIASPTSLSHTAPVMYWAPEPHRCTHRLNYQ
jgi:hypothetical protein